MKQLLLDGSGGTSLGSASRVQVIVVPLPQFQQEQEGTCVTGQRPILRGEKAAASLPRRHSSAKDRQGPCRRLKLYSVRSPHLNNVGGVIDLRLPDRISEQSDPVRHLPSDPAGLFDCRYSGLRSTPPPRMVASYRPGSNTGILAELRERDPGDRGPSGSDRARPTR